MTDNGQNHSEGRETWNHKTPVTFSPIFDWPPNPMGFILALTKRWVTVSRNVIFLLLAWLVYRHFLQDLSSMQSLSLGWILPIFLRNILFLFVIAVGCICTSLHSGRRGSDSSMILVNSWEKVENSRFVIISGTTCSTKGINFFGGR